MPAPASRGPRAEPAQVGEIADAPAPRAIGRHTAGSPIPRSAATRAGSTRPARRSAGPSSRPGGRCRGTRRQIGRQPIVDRERVVPSSSRSSPDRGRDPLPCVTTITASNSGRCAGAPAVGGLSEFAARRVAFPASACRHGASPLESRQRRRARRRAGGRARRRSGSGCLSRRPSLRLGSLQQHERPRLHLHLAAPAPSSAPRCSSDNWSLRQPC